MPFVFLALIVIVVVLSYKSYVKECQRTLHAKGTWWVLKKVDKDSGHQYIRIRKSFDSSDFWANYYYFEPDGKIGWGQNTVEEVIAEYEEVRSPEELESAFHRQVNKEDARLLNEKKKMQAQAKKAFLKK